MYCIYCHRFSGVRKSTVYISSVEIKHFILISYKTVCLLSNPMYISAIFVSCHTVLFLCIFFVQINMSGYHVQSYTANVYRELQGLYREIGVQEFQIYGDCMYTRNTCNFSVQVSMQILLWKNMYTLHVISLKFTGYPKVIYTKYSKH